MTKTQANAKRAIFEQDLISMRPPAAAGRVFRPVVCWPHMADNNDEWSTATSRKQRLQRARSNQTNWSDSWRRAQADSPGLPDDALLTALHVWNGSYLHFVPREVLECVVRPMVVPPAIVLLSSSSGQR